jgi:predicted kinase
MADGRRVPVLLFTGPVGVGKTTVAAEASRLLAERGVRHALVDLAHIGLFFPPPEDDPWDERLVQANLACMWANFQKAGAERLVLGRVLEARSLLGRIEAAVPGADVTVVRLRAPVEVLHARIRARESGRDAEWYLEAAASLAGTMDRDPVEDHLLDNVDRPAADVAADALRLAGWV